MGIQSGNGHDPTCRDPRRQLPLPGRDSTHAAGSGSIGFGKDGYCGMRWFGTIGLIVGATPCNSSRAGIITTEKDDRQPGIGDDGEWHGAGICHLPEMVARMLPRSRPWRFCPTGFRSGCLRPIRISSGGIVQIGVNCKPGMSKYVIPIVFMYVIPFILTPAIGTRPMNPATGRPPMTLAIIFGN